jgi:hypothetical protein
MKEKLSGEDDEHGVFEERVQCGAVCEGLQAIFE